MPCAGLAEAGAPSGAVAAGGATAVAAGCDAVDGGVGAGGVAVTGGFAGTLAGAVAAVRAAGSSEPLDARKATPPTSATAMRPTQRPQRFFSAP